MGFGSTKIGPGSGSSVAAGGAVGPAPGTAASAAAAFTRPPPLETKFTSTAVLIRRERMSAGVWLGFSLSMRPTIPDTSGAAALVPANVPPAPVRPRE
jgi:hypothetical protein